MNNDTRCLLNECHAGARMAIDSIDEVQQKVTDEEFRKVLTKQRDKHNQLKLQMEKLLNQEQMEGKEPSAMATAMSWLKTNWKLMMDPSNHTIAELMADGCNMGIKKVSEYKNQYQNASEESISIATDWVELEQQFVDELTKFL